MLTPIDEPFDDVTQEDIKEFIKVVVLATGDDRESFRCRFQIYSELLARREVHPPGVQKLLAVTQSLFDSAQLVDDLASFHQEIDGESGQ